MIRLLIIGDIHGEINTLINILNSADYDSLDGIVLTGDIGCEILLGASDHPPKQVKMYEITVRTILELATLTNIPIFMVPGNHDLPSLDTSTPGISNIDLLQYHALSKLGDYTFAGVGGSNWINGQFPYEWQENEAYVKLLNPLEKASANQVVLLSHCPPINSKLDLIGGTGNYGGSHTIRKLIATFQPVLCISGHIHESVGVDIVEGSLCINAGSILSPYPITFVGRNGVPERSIAMVEQCFLVELINDSQHTIYVHQILGFPRANLEPKITSYMFANNKLSLINSKV